jgi:NADH:ubiquinone oxidoreductase subunit 3 (subunit A)
MPLIDTNTLYLESLTKKYDTLLIQYNQAQIDYKTYVNENKNLPIKPKDLIPIKDAVIDSSQINSKLSSSIVSTLEKCTALCSADSKCKSATFNPVDYIQPQCWLNSVEGTLNGAGPNNYAIIPKEKELLLIIKSINFQLSDVNDEILEIVKKNKSYNESNKTLSEQFNKLQQNYKNLKFERIKILDKIHQFETLDEAQNYTSLTTNKSYYTFIILLLLFCICIFILSKIVIKTNFQSVGGVGILFTVFFIVLIISTVIFFYKR